MTKQLEELISSEIADFFAGVVDIHTELFGPNTIEEAQQKLSERVTRIATEREAKLIAALEQSQKQNADLKRDELLSDELAAAAAKELRRVEDLYTESQKRVAELEAQDSSIKPFIKPHKFSECVNGLLEAAIAYAGTQQLRARLSDRLSDFVEPDHQHNRAAGGTVGGVGWQSIDSSEKVPHAGKEVIPHEKE